jgi:hypothetical protein
MHFLRSAVLAIGLLGLGAACGGDKKEAEEPAVNPCGNPCAVEENPCANPCAENPCANPCGDNPCGEATDEDPGEAANPCGGW